MGRFFCGLKCGGRPFAACSMDGLKMSGVFAGEMSPTLNDDAEEKLDIGG